MRLILSRRDGRLRTTMRPSATITMPMPTNWTARTSSSMNNQASTVDVTGMASVSVEPSHTGMRVSDQFIRP